MKYLGRNRGGLAQRIRGRGLHFGLRQSRLVSDADEGWRLLPKHYDDGGLSGASLERPALQLLLTEVREGSVDVIVVYKVVNMSMAQLAAAAVVTVVVISDFEGEFGRPEPRGLSTRFSTP